MATEHNPVYLYQLPSGKEVFVDASGMVHTTNPNIPFDWKSHQEEFDGRPIPTGWETVETSVHD